MVLFITVYIIYFAWIGMRIFKGTIEGVLYFNTFGDSVFNMIVLLTASNFPEIMLPAYRQNRVSCLFFVVYLLFGIFLFMNLLQAMFYTNYKKRYEDTIEGFVDIRTMYLENQFNELD
jgi:two pore calcium channel protein